MSTLDLILSTVILILACACLLLMARCRDWRETSTAALRALLDAQESTAKAIKQCEEAIVLAKEWRAKSESRSAYRQP
jgi:anti-sigma factor ChrR (cupin superfamily)